MDDYTSLLIMLGKPVNHFGLGYCRQAADAIEALVAENAELRAWKAAVLAQPTAEEWSCGTQLINRPAL
jgi:hypothetical protein